MSPSWVSRGLSHPLWPQDKSGNGMQWAFIPPVMRLPALSTSRTWNLRGSTSELPSSPCFRPAPPCQCSPGPASRPQALPPASPNLPLPTWNPASPQLGGHPATCPATVPAAGSPPFRKHPVKTWPTGWVS